MIDSSCNTIFKMKISPNIVIKRTVSEITIPKHKLFNDITSVLFST